MYILNVSTLIITIIIQAVFGELCKIELFCNECQNCTDFSLCNFDNIFCKKDSQYSEILDDIYNKLITYIKNDPDINSFCNSRTISLDELKDSFTIFESASNKIAGNLNKLYSCEFTILNKYYLDHETDKAKLIMDINQKSGNNQIKFNIIFLYYYNKKDTVIYDTISDDKIRKNKFIKALDGISQLQILINFNKDNAATIIESLIISIETDNPSEKIRKIYIAIIVIISVLLLGIIVLIVVYIIIKRKMIRERELARSEEELKKEKNKKLAINFLNDELKSQLFNDKINLNDCDMCTICCEKFVINESEVSVTPCAHVFHYDCIKKWVNEKITDPHCPNCKFSFLEYMENPTIVQIKSSKNINKNDDITINNIKDDKKPEETVTPLSEQMRINPISVRLANNKNNKNNAANNNSEEVSIRISDIGDNNN